MSENEKHLLSIRDEMENVRELYIKGYIDGLSIRNKNTFEMAVEYGA